MVVVQIYFSGFSHFLFSFIWFVVVCWSIIVIYVVYYFVMAVFKLIIDYCLLNINPK